MTLAQAHVNTLAFNGFISTFGDNVTDLKMKIGDFRITCSVDMPTHYLKKSMSVVTHGEGGEQYYKPGDVMIPDVKKAIAFLKACKEELTYIRHVGNILTLKNGNDVFSTPTHNHTLSAHSVDRANEAVTKAKGNDWTKLGRAELTCHGMMSTSEFDGITTMTKVSAKDSPVRVTVEEGEMIITAGAQRGAKMSRIINVDVRDDAKPVTTVFGNHLPKLLSLVGAGEVIFHIGNKSALVLQHTETPTILVLKHQEGVDE